MKKVLLCIALLVCGIANAQVRLFMVQQPLKLFDPQNENTSYMTLPSSGESCIQSYFNPTPLIDDVPTMVCMRLGPGLSRTNDMLNVAVSWTSVTGKPSSLLGFGITDGVTTAQQATALAQKFNNPTGTTAQYIRGDGSLATLPQGNAIPTLNFGARTLRTFAASTEYQATDPTKPAIIKISPSCTAALSLTAGGTCTLQARVSASTLTCATGDVVATWTNANTGTLTIGLGLNQTIGSPANIELATGERFILCPTAGTFTLANGIDRALTIQ